MNTLLIIVLTIIIIKVVKNSKEWQLWRDGYRPEMRKVYDNNGKVIRTELFWVPRCKLDDK